LSGIFLLLGDNLWKSELLRGQALLPSPGFLPCGQKTHPASRSLTKAHFSTDCFKKKKTSFLGVWFNLILLIKERIKGGRQKVET